MGSIIFAVLFLFMIAYYDIAVRLRAFISYHWAKKYANRKAYKMSRIVFAVSRCYLNHRIAFHSNIPLHSLPSAFILVSNHQSIVDIPTLISCLPGFQLRFVAKDGLFRGVPLISMMLRLQRHGIIFRDGDQRKSYNELKTFARRCRAGKCPVVFPEGTRSETGTLRTFSSGALRVILGEVNLPIVTVAMDGGWIVSKAGQLATNLKNCLYRVGVIGLHQAPGSRSELEKDLLCYRNEIEGQITKWRDFSRPTTRQSVSGIDTTLG